MSTFRHFNAKPSVAACLLWSLPVVVALAGRAPSALGRCQVHRAPATDNTGKTTPTLKEIRARTESNRESISRVIFREQQSVETKSTTEQRELLRQRLEQSLADRNRPKDPIDVEEALLVSELNRSLTLDVARQIDRNASRVRIDIRDLRDVSKLAQEHGLSERATSGLAQSRSMILEASRHVLMPEGHALAVVYPPDKSLEEELELDRLGLIPTFVFDTDYDCKVVSLRDHIYSILGGRSGKLIFEVEIDGQKDYRMLSRKGYEKDGTTIGWSRSYSDYKKIEGQWVPGQVVERSGRDGAADYRTTILTTLNVEINPLVPSEAFGIPSDYRVQDIRPH